jgi:hypothetical protein
MVSNSSAGSVIDLALTYVDKAFLIKFYSFVFQLTRALSQIKAISGSLNKKKLFCPPKPWFLSTLRIECRNFLSSDRP